MAITVGDRVITLRLQRQSHYGELVERYINYNGSKLDLSESEFNDFLSKMPSLWNSDKDKLIYFVLFEDKSYLAQRYKEVYNFGTRETEEKLYNFDEANETELNAFVAFIANYYTALKLQRTENFYESILEKVADVSYMKYQLLEMRAKQLKETDYIVLPDYPISDEEKQQWIAYRQELRDITNQQAWLDNNFQSVVVPVSPRPKDQIVDMFNMVGSAYANAADLPPSLLESVKENIDGLGISGIIQKWTEITLKVEILKGIASLKVPDGLTTDELTAIEDLIPHGATDLVPEDQLKNLDAATKGQLDNWNDYLRSVDAKVESVNTKLQELSANFTLSDVIQKIAADMKEKADAHDAQVAASRLLEDLTIDEITGEE